MQYGRYEIVGELGKGAMGVVYNAHDPHIDRAVALKVLRKKYASDEYFVKRFVKEAVAIGRLSHPNIVTIYDVGEDEGDIYIAMEFLKGKELVDYARDKELSPEKIAKLGIQMAEALDYAHKKGIVHRDIKPANIILTEDGKVKITDFGIAHIDDTSATLQTQAGEILGTPVYMSPEQAMGKELDGRSDLYSLGIILYELAAGKRPFAGKNMAAIFHAVVNEAPEPPCKINPRVPQALSSLIMKCLEKDPEKRFQTGKDLASALREYLENKDRALPGTKSKTNAKPVLITVLCLALIAGIFLGWQYYNKPKLPEAPQPRKTAANIVKTPVLDAVLKIETDPENANVYIDGNLKGKTPLKISLPVGKHEIRMGIENYYDWEAQINLDKPGSETPLFIKLNRKAS